MEKLNFNDERSLIMNDPFCICFNPRSGRSILGFPEGLHECCSQGIELEEDSNPDRLATLEQPQQSISDEKNDNFFEEAAQTLVEGILSLSSSFAQEHGNDYAHLIQIVGYHSLINQENNRNKLTVNPQSQEQQD